MAKILVVDDDPIVCDAFSAFLTSAGHVVACATGGAEALERFASWRPEVVLLDSRMPGLSGNDVLIKMKQLSGEVPVVIITANEADSRGDEFLKAGAAAVISKKTGLYSVLEEVGRILRLLRARGPVPAAGGRAGTVTMLVVDDDDCLLDLMQRFFAPLGYTVLTAGDGAAGVLAARTARPDIVLLDIYMPNLDGVEVLKQLAPEMPRTGFIMISGGTDEEVARSCLRLGAFDYITKPINMAQLEKIISVRLFLKD